MAKVAKVNAYKEYIRQVIETDTLTTDEKVNCINNVVAKLIAKIDKTKKRLDSIMFDLF